MFDCNLLKNGMCINLCIFCLELSCVNFVDIMCCTDIIDVKKKTIDPCTLSHCNIFS